ncbi:MAG: hypothetical protein AAFR70_05415, partial [Pseudomonadota bacterium]
MRMSLGTRANRFEARPMVAIAALALTASAITLAIACPATAADELDGIVTRDAWGAKPGNAKIMKRQTPREIIIHMTGVRMQPKISLERKMRGLQGYSQRRAKIGRRFRRAWGDIPYHYYIGVSGRVAKGRDINFAGDTNTKYDVSDRIQVVVMSADLVGLDAIGLRQPFRQPNKRFKLCRTRALFRELALDDHLDAIAHVVHEVRR